MSPQPIDDPSTTIINAAVEYADHPCADIREMMKSGFALGAKNIPLESGYSKDNCSEVAWLCFETAWKAGYQRFCTSEA